MTPREFHNFRLQLNRTQVELARMLGVTPTTISRYEIGLRGISAPIANLLRLLVQLHAEDVTPAAGRRRVVHTDL